MPCRATAATTAAACSKVGLSAQLTQETVVSATADQKWYPKITASWRKAARSRRVRTYAAKCSARYATARTSQPDDVILSLRAATIGSRSACNLGRHDRRAGANGRYQSSSMHPHVPPQSQHGRLGARDVSQR